MGPGETPQLAHDVVAIVREILGDAVLGAYLHGSGVMGGLRPTSDVDVLVVVERSMSDDERRSLVGRLLEVSGRLATRGPARPVELTVVVRSEVSPWHYPPMVEFQYAEWLRDDYQTGLVPFAERSPDLATLITMARAGNTPLYGPPPAELLDPVPMHDLRAAIVAAIPGLMRDIDSDARNVLLTLARIWATLATGAIHSKVQAAAFAIPLIPAGEQRATLELARDLYVDGIADDATTWANLAPRPRDLAAYMVGEIAQLGLG